MARAVGGEMKKKSFIEDVIPVETNIVICQVDEKLGEAWLLEELKKEGVFSSNTKPAFNGNS